MSKVLWRTTILLSDFILKLKVDGGSAEVDASFAEVSGLDADREILDIKEGGENRFSHRLPGPTKPTNLVLKRGVVVASSPLFDWCREVVESDLNLPIAPRDLNISLLDPEGTPLINWNVHHAWPAKWSIGALNASENSVAMETLEFAYNRLTRTQIKTTSVDGLFNLARGLI